MSALQTLALAAAALAALQDPTVVHADGPGVWGPTRLVEEVRIGVVDGPDELMFGMIGDIEPTESGDLWVWDHQFEEIRVYDRSGRFVRRVGREGAGPGEHRRILGIERAPDGRMVTWDADLGRLTWWEANGDYSESVTAALGGFYTGDEMLVVDRFGQAHVRASTAQVRDGDLIQDWVAVGPNGEALARTRIPLPGTGRSMASYRLQGPTWPYVRSTRSVLSTEGYLVVGHNEDYAFELRRPDGVLRIERDFEPVRVTRAERQAWEESLERAAMRSPSMGMEPPDQAVPRTKPAYIELYATKDGRIWVDRYAEAVRLEEPRLRGELEWAEPRTFDVFEPDGEFLGTVVLPRANAFREADGEWVWCVATGELGVQQIVRYRIEAAGME